jgi:biotin carboxyl carrier protein
VQLPFQHGDELILLEVEQDGDGWRVRLPDGSQHRITAERLPGDILRITHDSRTFQVPFARSARGLEISYGGNAYAFTPTSTTRKTSTPRKPAGTLAAPMGGVVADVLVAEGQTVDAYDPLIVVEAMKVYATVEAPFAGIVKSVSVKKGDRVELGQQLIDIEKASES